ncbi:MAG: hypothetical protein C3F13_11845 [Anaerolineales bacterium]|nr:hypothetical protein [Anaerolineae bacterium]PWB52214.1 MAG: hypothetical protein C3F13_11845 [Anaerolineales bacterium]
MSQLSLSLLGKPSLLLNGQPVNLPTSRGIPLLAYLAMTDIYQSREALASLLWTDNSQGHALAALRTTLWRLKGSDLKDWIGWDRNEVWLTQAQNINFDVAKFYAALERCNTHGHPLSQVCLLCTPALTDALEVYRGEFMHGSYLAKAGSFENWRTQQRDNFEMMHLGALERLVKCHRKFGDFNLAIHYARIWLAHDSLNESANAQLLQLYAITEQRTAGMSLYKHYKQLLEQEFGIAPSDEITALYKQLVRGHTTPVSKKKVLSPIFLIADIERAPIYWGSAGDHKDDLLNTYREIFKDASRRFGGTLIQKTENRITLLFENGQPLHCAVYLHLLFKKTDWGMIGPPSVRMVLYSTVLEEDNPGDFAMLTSAASSLLSISWGGQILFSESTLKLLDFPSGAKINDLGFHSLINNQAPVHIYELCHPHLPAKDHPPLLSTSQQLFNFPIFDVPFIGREEELGELHRSILLPTNRLVSLTGPGGVGKTRLAVQFAPSAVDFFPDGIYFVSFASIEDADFIPILLADALRFNFYGPTSHTEQLTQYLHRMKALLVIDNFEHLRLEGAKFLAILLSNTHYLKFIVTTRERMNLIAETVVEVVGFPIPDLLATDHPENFTAIKLFIQNAQKNYPRFTIPNNLKSIIRICGMVDGMPLGILLASAWVRVFSCPEIEAEISKNIDFLTTHAPDLDPRHRSLSAVFENSWKLLPEAERSVLGRLSIFSSPFTGRAAQEICGATPLALSQLVDKSLLLHQQDGRFFMLNTISHFAAAKLEEYSTEQASTMEKYCEYYAELCAQKIPEINSLLQHNAIKEMISEIENIRSAWMWMIQTNRWDLINKTKDALLIYHVLLGNYIHGSELFTAAFQKITSSNQPEVEITRYSLRQLSAWMDFRKGYVSRALPEIDECLEYFRSHDAKWETAMTLFYLSVIHQALNHIHLAKDLILESIELLERDGGTKSNYVLAIIANCQTTLGGILVRLDQYSQAKSYLNMSLTTHNKLGTTYGALHSLMGLGRLANLESKYMQARDLFLQALELAGGLFNHRDMVSIHNNLSSVYESMAHISLSYHHIQIALKLCKESGDRRLTAVILNNLAYEQLRYHNQPTTAIRTYQECLEIFSEVGDLRGIAFSCYDISKAYLKVGLLEDAWSYNLRSINTAMTLDDISLVLHALHGFANFFVEVNLPERGLGLCYLIEHHPQVDRDTQKRAIVTRAFVEASLDNITKQSVRVWGENADLQETINQIMADKSYIPRY